MEICYSSATTLRRKNAQLDPNDVATDNAGNLYVADLLNHRIRKINLTSMIISTVAGIGTPGYSGDGGPAASAQLRAPTSMAVDAAGNLYIADNGNSVVRRVSATTGVISTIAGNGKLVFNAETGTATVSRHRSDAHRDRCERRNLFHRPFQRPYPQAGRASPGDHGHLVGRRAIRRSWNFGADRRQSCGCHGDASGRSRSYFRRLHRNRVSQRHDGDYGRRWNGVHSIDAREQRSGPLADHGDGGRTSRRHVQA